MTEWVSEVIRPEAGSCYASATTPHGSAFTDAKSLDGLLAMIAHLLALYAEDTGNQSTHRFAFTCASSPGRMILRTFCSDVAQVERQMVKWADLLEFEKAAIVGDQVKQLNVKLHRNMRAEGSVERGSVQ